MSGGMSMPQHAWTRCMHTLALCMIHARGHAACSQLCIARALYGAGGHPRPAQQVRMSHCCQPTTPWQQACAWALAACTPPTRLCIKEVPPACSWCAAGLCRARVPSHSFTVHAARTPAAHTPQHPPERCRALRTSGQQQALRRVPPARLAPWSTAATPSTCPPWATTRLTSSNWS